MASNQIDIVKVEKLAMQAQILRDPELLGMLATMAICIGGVAYYLNNRKRPDPDELERERRLSLVRTGRIIDGTVLDISDLAEVETQHPGGLQLILYKYEIAGVVYECSQDVAALKNFVDIHACRLGFPCSVRYDPHQPENSILVAETWSGLRETVTPFLQKSAPASNAGSVTTR